MGVGNASRGRSVVVRRRAFVRCRVGDACRTKAVLPPSVDQGRFVGGQVVNVAADTIVTERLLLRPLVPGGADAEHLVHYKQRFYAAFKPWWPAQDPSRFTLMEQEALLEQFARDRAEDRRYAFGLFVRSSDDLAGRVHLNNVVRGAFHSADAGYDIAPPWRGQGLMTEALGAVLGWATSEIRLHRMQAAVIPRNAASLAVLRHHGFERIGIAPQYLKIDGCWQDHVLLQKLLYQEEPS